MKTNVWIQVGVIAAYGCSIDAEVHKHQSIQLVWPVKDSDCLLCDEVYDGPIIVNSQVPHQLTMSEGWVVLVEPKSQLGEALTQMLDGQPIKAFEQSNSALVPPTSELSLHDLLTPLFTTLKLPSGCLPNNVSSIEEPRIKKLLVELDSCLQGDCIKPMNWKASEVASQLALSESRFLHLFSETMGIAWRPYLLWRRSLCAIQAMHRGQSATEAAYMAGFSDSAHLSRTFKRQFGMTIRQALSLFKS